MPKAHELDLLRKSYRLDEPTVARLQRIAKFLAARDAAAVGSETNAIRFAAQIAEIFDKETYDQLLAIIARLGAKDSSGAPALGQGIKFAINIAAKAAGPKRNNPATE